MQKETCLICGCRIHHEGNYAEANLKGRSHATKHHYIAKRFFNPKGEKKESIFKQSPWPYEGQTAVFCYECHEDLLHNPVLLPKNVHSLLIF
jgi:hypothetical protein